MIIKFHEQNEPVTLKYSVIVAKDERGFVFVRHNNRSTWEIPGGHIEKGETAKEAANRELVEETGAKNFNLTEVCNYSVTVGDSTTYGGLFYAEIISYGGSLDYEIGEVKSFEELPLDLTYPQIQPFLFEEVNKRMA